MTMRRRLSPSSTTLVGAKEDEEGEIFREVAQIVAQAQAKSQAWFEVIAQACTEFFVLNLARR